MKEAPERAALVAEWQRLVAETRQLEKDTEDALRAANAKMFNAYNAVQMYDIEHKVEP